MLLMHLGRNATWSRRPESNRDLALRRRSFYPLNYGEMTLGHCPSRHIFIAILSIYHPSRDRRALASAGPAQSLSVARSRRGGNKARRRTAQRVALGGSPRNPRY